MKSVILDEEMIDMRRLRGKHLYDTPFALENIKLEDFKEGFEEAIARKPTLQGCLAEGDQKVILKAYFQEYQIGMEVILCAFFYKLFRAERMMKTNERELSIIGSEDICKTYKCHPNQKWHTIEKCVEFKNVVRYLFDIDSVTNMWECQHCHYL